MTEPAISITPTTIKKAIAKKPPLLNNRIFLREYNSEEAYIARTIRTHCDIVTKCGLTPEIEATGSITIKIYAAYRRDRNKHDA